MKLITIRLINGGVPQTELLGKWFRVSDTSHRFDVEVDGKKYVKITAAYNDGPTGINYFNTRSGWTAYPAKFIAEAEPIGCEKVFRNDCLLGKQGEKVPPIKAELLEALGTTVDDISVEKFLGFKEVAIVTLAV